jgi:hypothetical protein
MSKKCSDNAGTCPFIHNRVFGTDALFIRTENTVGARERATPSPAQHSMQENISNCGEKNLRGRRPVRADRRLCADEKAIRAQSAILYENNPKPYLFSAITVFFVRTRFSSARKARLARASAQRLRITSSAAAVSRRSPDCASSRLGARG